jgi:hypothetical protein
LDLAATPIQGRVLNAGTADTELGMVTIANPGIAATGDVKQSEPSQARTSAAKFNGDQQNPLYTGSALPLRPFDIDQSGYTVFLNYCCQSSDSPPHQCCVTRSSVGARGS